MTILLGNILVLACESANGQGNDTYERSNILSTKYRHSEFMHLSLSNCTANGIIVPLYSMPGNDWTRVIYDKTNHPLVPVVAIVNPQNGPGMLSNPVYFEAIKQLEDAHVVVLGYVYTQYGARNSTEIIKEISNYKTWYNVDGIFFDEMSNVPGKETYYQSLNVYAKSIGAKHTVGNPGQSISPSYIGTVDNLVIYDNPGLVPLSTLGELGENAVNFSVMSFDTDIIDESYVKNASKYVKYLYVTNGTVPDPWNPVSPYLENLTSIIQNIIMSDDKIKTFLPLRQLNCGAESHDVKCIDGLELLLKKENGFPACVRPSSAHVLIQRGWGEKLS